MDNTSRPWADLNLPTHQQWTGPPVECYICGVRLNPVKTLTRGFMLWSLPVHSAFAGWAPGICGGSGRLIGPVTP